MGIHQEYARLTEAELQRAIVDPRWAEDRLDELGEAWVEDDSEPEEARFFSVDKSWEGIRLVLANAGLTLELIHGESQELQVAQEWDYGPPTYLTPPRVSVAAQLLGALPFADLVRAVDADQVRADDLYMVGEWTEDDLDYVTYHGERLQRFYAAAAKAGDAIIVMLT